ncbi:MAG: 50S ribosomal protein L10 [bacterium]|nr:50S ribosomal protein L10 [bacterium]
MAKTKQEKGVIIDKLAEAFKNGASSVFVHFTKVSVAEESAMRRALRNDGVSYFVAKKTLMRRALDTMGLKHDELPLEGEVSIAYGGADSTAASRLVHEWGSKLVGKLTILGGIFEGKLVGQAYMQEIATIPSMQVLRGMFVNVINSPIAGLAIALKAVADKRAA